MMTLRRIKRVLAISATVIAVTMVVIEEIEKVKSNSAVK